MIQKQLTVFLLIRRCGEATKPAEVSFTPKKKQLMQSKSVANSVETTPLNLKKLTRPAGKVEEAKR